MKTGALGNRLFRHGLATALDYNSTNINLNTKKLIFLKTKFTFIGWSPEERKKRPSRLSLSIKHEEEVTGEVDPLTPQRRHIGELVSR